MGSGDSQRSYADGWMACSPTSSNIMFANVEVTEQKIPIRFIKREVVIDHSGDGKFRGGGGLEVQYEAECPITADFRSNRRVYP